MLAPEDAAIKISGLHGVISALWEVDKFNEAYPYLKKQALYFSVVIPPSKECVDALFKDELYFRLGYCAFEDQRYWDAIEAYKEIPKNITAQYNLALIWIGNPGIRSKRNAMEVIQKVKLLDKEKYNILMDKYEEAFEAKKTKD